MPSSALKGYDVGRMKMAHEIGFALPEIWDSMFWQNRIKASLNLLQRARIPGEILESAHFFFFFCSCFQLFVQSNFSFELLKAVPSLVLALFFAHPAVFYGHAENTRPNDKSD